MNLTGDQLKELLTMAGLFIPVAEIMTAIGIALHQEDDFIELIRFNKTHPAFLAYNKGRLEAETELRQAIKQAARNGSNPAQTTMMEFYYNSQL
jgi:hypothetical protein